MSKTMATGKALDGKSYAESPHTRFDEREVALAEPRRGVLLYRPLAICVAACVGLVSTGFARITNFWVGASGNWSDTNNWYLDRNGNTPANHYPGQDPEVTDDVAYFAPTATGTVTLDVDATIWRFSVEASTTQTSMTFESDAENPHTLKMTTSTTSSIGEDSSVRGKRTVTFKNIKVRGVSLDFRGGNGIFGSGADIAGMTGGQTSLYVWEEDKVLRYLDGCTVKASLYANRVRGTHQIEGGSVTGKYEPASNRNTLRIMGGTCNFSGGVTLSTNSTVEISGGTVSMSAMILQKPGATVIIAGGDVTCAAMPVLRDDTTFIFTNGMFTVTASAATTDRRLLGSDDAVFRSTVAPNSTSSSADYYTKKPSINVFTNDGDSATFSGTIFATNGTYSALHFTNSATVNANVMNLSRITIAAAKDVTINANRINLGVRLFPSVNGPTLTIPYGTTFGAFGNWYVYNKTFTLYLNGDIFVDTTDCFDGTTPRRIGLYKAYPRPGSSFTVRGCGTLDLAFSSSSPNAFRLRGVDVDDGATLILTSNGTCVVANQCRIGAGASLRLKAGTASFDATHLTMDPTANIVMEVPSGLAKNAYPVAMAQDDETAALIASRTTLVGEGAGSWSLRAGPNVAYLYNGTEPTYGDIGTSNIWNGMVSGDYADAQNWVGGTVAYSATAISGKTADTADDAYIGGCRNTVITNTFSGTVHLGRLAFLDNCGPVRLSGGKFQVARNGYSNTSTTPICSLSRFPVIVESDIATPSSLCTVAGRDSYIALNGNTTVSYLFRPNGEVRVGGNLTCKGLLLETVKSSGRSTKLQVLEGGKVSVTAQYTNQVIASSRIVVDGGGTLEFLNGTGAVCGHFATMNVANIDGLMDVKCPYLTTKPQPYYGTGTVQIASTRTHVKGSGSVIIGGGLTLKPTSWNTVTADAPDNYIKIAVTNEGILSASADWTYGPEAGVATATTAAERALEIADHATLTVKTDGYTVSFADPIVGAGSLVVAEGSKLALAGDLLASAKNGWTTFATVGSFTCADGAFPENYKLYTVDNGDGTIDVQAKIRPGMALMIQ